MRVCVGGWGGGGGGCRQGVGCVGRGGGEERLKGREISLRSLVIKFSQSVSHSVNPCVGCRVAEQ